MASSFSLSFVFLSKQESTSWPSEAIGGYFAFRPNYRQQTLQTEIARLNFHNALPSSGRLDHPRAGLVSLTHQNPERKLFLFSPSPQHVFVL